MGKIKVLFLAANPVDTQQLRLDEQIRAISGKIRMSEYRDSLELVSVWAVQTDDLLQSLNEHKPHIVHFSGHGTKGSEILAVGSDGKSKPISKKAIKALFSTVKDNIRIVILDACYTGPQAEAVTEEIDCAIGMKNAIGERAATIFTATFYGAIGFGRSIQEAFNQGKTALLLEGIPEDDTPELLVRVGVDPSQMFLLTHDAPGDRRVMTNRVQEELEKLKKLTVAPRFHWFIISGSSSSGKDVLIHSMEERLARGYKLAIATKYTTRPRRLSEPENILELSEEEFSARKRSGGILFPYSKRTTRYGFNTSEFRDAISEGVPLISVFTEFAYVPRIAKAMNDRGMPTTPIFIEVAQEHLLRRILFRNLPAEEVQRRAKSIYEDFREMSRRKTFRDEYTFIRNGDDCAFEDTLEDLIDLAESKLGSKKWFT